MYVGPSCEVCDDPNGLEEQDDGIMLCENCLQNRAEAAWERFCEDFYDGGSTSFISLEQRMAEARKLK